MVNESGVLGTSIFLNSYIVILLSKISIGDGATHVPVQSGDTVDALYGVHAVVVDDIQRVALQQHCIARFVRIGDEADCAMVPEQDGSPIRNFVWNLAVRIAGHFATPAVRSTSRPLARCVTRSRWDCSW